MAKIKTVKYISLEDFYKDYEIKDVQDLVNAIKAAEHPKNPSRYRLIQIYNKVWDDEHIFSVCQTRMLQATQIPFVLSKDDGTEDDNKVCESAWFDDFREAYYDSLFFGHSVVEFHLDEKTGKIKNILVLDREYFEPRLRRFLPDPKERGNFLALDDILEEYPNLLEISGKKNPLGLLRKCAKSGIIRSYIVSNWAEFTDRFGQPYLVAKTDMRDEKRVGALGEVLADVGTGSALVMGVDENLNVLESTQRDSYNIFERLIDKCEASISKSILGQTMTTDNGSSLAQGEVHLKILNGYTRYDIKKEVSMLNATLLPFLLRNGHIPEGYKFKVKPLETFTRQEKLDLVMKLLEYYDIDKEWIVKQFEIPIIPKIAYTGSKKKRVPQSQSKINKAKEKIRQLYADSEYNHSGQYCSDHSAPASPYAIRIAYLPTEITDTLIEDVFNGGVSELHPKTYLHISNELIKSVSTGYNKGINELDFLSEEGYTAYKLFASTMRFSAFKVKSIINELNSAKKQTENWQEFKELAQNIMDRHAVWLNTENQTALAISISARQWHDFMLNPDMPNLKYVTAGDSRVRKEHDRLDGVTLPKTDKFWDTHFPPIDYNCRCDIQEVSSAITKNPLTDVKVHPLFAHNPGKNGILIPDSHPYFNVDKPAKVMQDFTDIEPRFFQTIKKCKDLVRAFSDAGNADAISSVVAMDERVIAEIVAKSETGLTSSQANALAWVSNGGENYAEIDFFTKAGFAKLTQAPQGSYYIPFLSTIAGDSVAINYQVATTAAAKNTIEVQVNTAAKNILNLSKEGTVIINGNFTVDRSGETIKLIQN